jgi:hypothetical protein
MNAVQYAQSQLKQAFGLVNMCLDGMTEAQFNFSPGGTANPPAKTAVHIATPLDFFILHTIKGDPMQWPEVAAANGLPANGQEIWKFEGAIPMQPVIDYNKRLQEQVVDYVGTLSESDLERVIETQFFGKQTVAFLLQLFGGHAVSHAGEIAALKGMQGLKGLPF